MTYDNLKFESIVENDIIQVIRNALTAQNVYPGIPISRGGIYASSEQYPKITVKTDSLHEEFEKIFSGDISVYCDTYLLDDKLSAGLDDLVSAVRFAFIDPSSELSDRLTAASEFFTYFAAVCGEGFPDPDSDVRRYTLQLQVKFSPVK